LNERSEIEVEIKRVRPAAMAMALAFLSPGTVVMQLFQNETGTPNLIAHK
jgi:hypothetical protein